MRVFGNLRTVGRWTWRGAVLLLLILILYRLRQVRDFDSDGLYGERAAESLARLDGELQKMNKRLDGMSAPVSKP